MAQLIAEVQGSRGSVHRLGSTLVTAHLASWTHSIDVWLDNKGGYKIGISRLHGRDLKVIEGNMRELEGGG